jgi:hypothetical protein
MGWWDQAFGLSLSGGVDPTFQGVQWGGEKVRTRIVCGVLNLKLTRRRILFLLSGIARGAQGWRS